MGSDNDFVNFMLKQKQLKVNTRAIRLTLAPRQQLADDVLLPQFVTGKEAICDGFTYCVNCVATSNTLALKEFIGVPATLQFVTDRGQLRKISGLVAEASSGDSDGAIASYQIVIRDALAIMGNRVNTRVFRHMSWPQVVKTILGEWQHINTGLIGAFDYEFAPNFNHDLFREREQTLQFNESDSAFLRRVLARAGIGWFFRVGRNRSWQQRNQDDSYPAHTLVLFHDQRALDQNAAGSVHYHRDAATEKRDTITRWGAVRKLQAGSATRFSWDYKNPDGTTFMATDTQSRADQGLSGNVLAAGLNEYIIDPPHVGDNVDELVRLGTLYMRRKDLETKCFHGEGSVRDFCAGEYFILADHPEIDRHDAADREFVITSVELAAQNNLPQGLEARIQRLFDRNSWLDAPYRDGSSFDFATQGSPVRFHMRFEAVRRSVPIVPAFDPRTDLPDPGLQSAIVVGLENEEIHCDSLGRVKIRFPATRPADHKHAYGAGASNTQSDSAWVRVASNWAGSSTSHCGTLALPRVGTEVLVAFLGGDPDKPIIIGQLFNGRALPPPLSSRANLPLTRVLSGMRSQEIRGGRANQLCFDDTPREISAQLASDDGASQLNLGWLTQPRDNRHRPRGEGAELRSDKAVAVRGGKGVLITAKASNEAEGNQLDRDELIGLTDGLRNIADQLSKLAETHSKDRAAGPELAGLVDKLRNLHQGTNVVSRDTAGGGGAPIVAVSGPAGIVIASQENLALGAEKNADLITAADTTFTAGGTTSFYVRPRA
ncbi:type VI secretion system Vgr family protein [Massilia horti]|uniref:Type VI secretion system tip protein VgrG n=1 Tax=Massilia horti TaxID=2562153 RepID=A0A4Y9T7Y2_9BURK|nr:type VI secretion system Vgr family protein [Massilia horti]TFW33609.1 type VI secretion system tip protein VgrG [Massilia horti]